jgi:L-fuconolactonase
MLAEYGLSFDICIKHWQLPASVELVKQCPNVSFILDHIGKPNIGSGELEPWRSNIFKLAELPNVICKVSGMANEASASWTLEDLRPYFDTVYEAFGEDRVAFGGDWPVCTLATTYAQWVKTVETLTASLSEAAQRKLWNTNAKRFYRIA